MEGPVKVTIEFPESQGMKPLVLEYPQISITQERGLTTVYEDRGHLMWGQPSAIVPNGHRRACIKLWSGCKTFEEFRDRDQA
jgi:hypothetical protein